MHMKEYSPFTTEQVGETERCVLIPMSLSLTGQSIALRSWLSLCPVVQRIRNELSSVPSPRPVHGKRIINTHYSAVIFSLSDITQERALWLPTPWHILLLTQNIERTPPRPRKPAWEVAWPLRQKNLGLEAFCFTQSDHLGCYNRSTSFYLFSTSGFKPIVLR